MADKLVKITPQDIASIAEPTSLIEIANQNSTSVVILQAILDHPHTDSACLLAIATNRNASLISQNIITKLINDLNSEHQKFGVETVKKIIKQNHTPVLVRELLHALATNLRTKHTLLQFIAEQTTADDSILQLILMHPNVNKECMTAIAANRNVTVNLKITIQSLLSEPAMANCLTPLYEQYVAINNLLPPPPNLAPLPPDDNYSSSNVSSTNLTNG